MKKLLLMVGIISFIVCILSFMLCALNAIGYYNMMDGTMELYSSLFQKMIVSFIVGVAFALIGSLCMFLRFRR